MKAVVNCAIKDHPIIRIKAFIYWKKKAWPEI